MTKHHTLWVEQYRPTTLDQYVFHDETHRAAFAQMVADKQIPQLLLSGVQGTGKTTIAKVLIRGMELDSSDVLTINASDERGIDTFRDTIKSFASTHPFGEFKIVHLEEADALTPAAQQALKQFMEEASDYVRFILTCNHENKIIAPIKSRCQHFCFRAPDHDDVAEYLATILVTERVKFTLDDLDKFIAFGYPDVRKIVNLLQMHTHDGVLTVPTQQGNSSEWKFALIDLISAGNWADARKLACTSVSPTEWEDVYRFLYENLDKSPRFVDNLWQEGIVIIAEHLFKHSICSDPEINAAACFIRLGQL